MSLPRAWGPFTLLRKLAVGGMAEIYVAKALGLGGFEKLMALKLVHPHLSADPQFVRMLVDEAKILVLLRHANIAQVFDLGCIEQTYYIAMEYVDGVDVQGLARAAHRLGRPLPVPICCFLVSEMLHGLDYAHTRCDAAGRPLGIVHRDVSPQNVVVSRGGEVKLVDFGIAKTNLRADETAAGVIKGKYAYMSPEQAWADPADRRSDVFSAGVMLYELLTGQPLYRASSMADMIAKVRRAEIEPPNRRRPEIPDALCEIVMKAVALEPSDRFQSASEMESALRELSLRSASAVSGVRLGRFVVELLEAEERLKRDQTQPSARLEGLGTLTREDFLPDETSVIFAPGDSHRLTFEGDGSRAPAAPRAGAQAEGRDEEGEETELWTARWLELQGGSLRPAIHVREPSAVVPERQSSQGSLVPPTLSWPPLTSSPSRGPGPESAAAPRALVPPRGDEASLGPLPPSPGLPRVGLAPGSVLSLRAALLWAALVLIVLGALVLALVWGDLPR